MDRNEIQVATPYFPQYVNEFLADVSGWPVEAVGAYARLQCQAWRDEPVGSLSNDDEVLALKAGVTLVVWREIRPVVLSLCRTGTDGRVHFPRLRTAFEEHRRYSKSRSENAKRGWDKRKVEPAARAPVSSSPDAYASDMQSTRNGNTEHMVCPLSSSASAISNAPSERESRAGARERAAPDDLASPADGFESGGGDDLTPQMTPIEVALCRACGWIPDRLDHQQWFQVKSAVKALDGQDDVTPERIGLAGDFYRSQRKFSFSPTWIGRDWGQIREWLRAQENGQDYGGGNGKRQHHETHNARAARKTFELLGIDVNGAGSGDPDPDPDDLAPPRSALA